MYLTRFRVNTQRMEARYLFRSPHRMHGAVNASFPEPPSRDGSGPRVLWRVDRTADKGATLFVASPERPDLTHLVEQAGWPTLERPGWTTYDYNALLDRLSTGDTWNFRLAANPVHHIRHPEKSKPGEDTKRTAHRTPVHQAVWLLQKQENAGFEVLSRATDQRADAAPGAVRSDPADRHEELRALLKDTATARRVLDGLELMVHDHNPLQFDRSPSGDGGRRGKKAHNVRITRVTFDGRLRVTDSDTFRRTLTHGLGKAKAYGCGLMTLTPVD